MKCENCSSKHDGSYGSGRFCDVTCARGFSTKAKRNEINVKVSKTLGGKNYTPKEDNCLWCGGKLSRTAKKYCKGDCQHLYEYNIKINSWLIGVDGFNNSFRCPDFIRKYLWEKYKNKCSRCGWKEINPLLKKPILEIEHIDGDCLNHSYKNVDLICTNCHTLTPTYRALNKGNPKRSKNVTYGGRSYKK